MVWRAADALLPPAIAGSFLKYYYKNDDSLFLKYYYKIKFALVYCHVLV
jgi:hypothetical protein